MKFPISRRFSRRGKLPAAAAYENHAAWRRLAAADNTGLKIYLSAITGSGDDNSDSCSKRLEEQTNFGLVRFS